MRIFLFFLFSSLQTLWANAILPADQVFKPHIQWLNDEIQLQISVPESYYLYANRTFINGQQHYQSTPEAQSYHDDYLGKVLIWNENVNLSLPRGSASSLILETQGCQKNVICYPPQRWVFEAPQEALPPAKKSLFNKHQDAPLPAESAFQADVQRDETLTRVQIKMPDGYYLYRSSIRAEADASALSLDLPQGEWHDDPDFGRVEIYRHELNFTIPNKDLNQANSLRLHWQGCAEHRLCYPPQHQDWQWEQAAEALQKERFVPEQALPQSSQDWLYNLQQRPLWSVLLVFLAGLAVSLTACVYPLLPIVSGIIWGEEKGTRRGFVLVLTYVLAMGFALALLGLVFSLSGLNLQLVLQQPLFATISSILLFLLALSLFDVYVLRLPRALQNRVERFNHQQKSGSLMGAAVMGALSVLVISPCATPVLSALLLLSPQDGWRSALNLFVFGIGMGTPLLLFATALKRFLPRTGAWMLHLKSALAFLVLGVSVWLLARTLNHYSSYLWSLYALVLGVYLLPPQWSSKNEKIRLFLALLAFLSAFQLSFAPRLPEALPANPTAEALQLSDIRARIERSQKPVLLDFYADWCVSCRHWERDIWANPEVKQVLSAFQFIKIDMSDFNESHREILSAFELVGPPAVLFFPAGEALQAQDKIIGETSVTHFLQKLAQWQQF